MQWRLLQPQERVAYVNDNLARLFPNKRQPGGLVRLGTQGLRRGCPAPDSR